MRCVSPLDIGMEREGGPRSGHIAEIARDRVIAVIGKGKAKGAQARVLVPHSPDCAGEGARCSRKLIPRWDGSCKSFRPWDGAGEGGPRGSHIAEIARDRVIAVIGREGPNSQITGVRLGSVLFGSAEISVIRAISGKVWQGDEPGAL
jgi:ribosomal protein S28E/S33